MNKQSGFNAEQINKDKNLESKNRLKIKSKITSYHNKTKTVRLSNQWVRTREDNILSKFSTLFIDSRLVVSIQTNHTCHITSSQLRVYIFTYIFFFLIEPHWFFIHGGKWRKPPRKVSYKHTFGMPGQGQMLDVWESQTTESALRWQMRHIAPRHIHELTLEVILEHVLGIKTMTWIFNPGSRSKSLSLPSN